MRPDRRVEGECCQRVIHITPTKARPAKPGRRGLRPDSARSWPNLAAFLLFLFRAFFSPPTPRGSLPGRIMIPLNRDGRHTARMPFNLKRGADAGLRHWRHNPMFSSGNKVSIFSALCMLFALLMLTACKGDWRLPTPPFGVPVDLSRGGVVADFNIRVTRHWLYRFEIHFSYPEGDRAERERLRKLVGEYGRDKNNNLIEPGILTPVKLMIFEKQAQNEQMVYQKTIKDPETVSYSISNFTKEIGYCDLPPGEYRLILESLAQPQEYASIPTLFYIATNGKFSFNPKTADRSKSCPEKVTQ